MALPSMIADHQRGLHRSGNRRLDILRGSRGCPYCKQRTDRVLREDRPGITKEGFLRLEAHFDEQRRNTTLFDDIEW